MRDGKEINLVTTIGKVTSKSQITIPKELARKINLKAGDHIEFEIKDGGIFLKPMLLINKDQAWFWTEGWQRAEREVDEEKKEGKIKTVNSIDELMRDLKDED